MMLQRIHTNLQARHPDFSSYQSQLKCISGSVSKVAAVIKPIFIGVNRISLFVHEALRSSVSSVNFLTKNQFYKRVKVLFFSIAPIFLHQYLTYHFDPHLSRRNLLIRSIFVGISAILLSYLNDFWLFKEKQEENSNFFKITITIIDYIVPCVIAFHIVKEFFFPSKISVQENIKPIEQNINILGDPSKRLKKIIKLGNRCIDHYKDLFSEEHWEDKNFSFAFHSFQDKLWTPFIKQPAYSRYEPHFPSKNLFDIVFSYSRAINKKIDLEPLKKIYKNSQNQRAFIRDCIPVQLLSDLASCNKALKCLSFFSWTPYTPSNLKLLTKEYCKDTWKFFSS